MSTSPSTEPKFQIGDRIELNADANALRQGLLPLDSVLASFLSQTEVFLDAGDEAAALKFNSAQGAFKSVKLLRPLAKQPGTILLECVSASPPRFRLMVEPPAAIQLSSSANDWIAFNSDDVALLENRFAFARWRDFRLALQATRLAMVAGFDQLLCLPWLHDVELLEHQLRTARTVLRACHVRCLCSPCWNEHGRCSEKANPNPIRSIMGCAHWETGVNDIGTPRPDTISPIPESISLLEAERIAREREPGDRSPQKGVIEKFETELARS